MQVYKSQKSSPLQQFSQAGLSRQKRNGNCLQGWRFYRETRISAGKPMKIPGGIGPSGQLPVLAHGSKRHSNGTDWELNRRLPLFILIDRYNHSRIIRNISYIQSDLDHVGTVVDKYRNQKGVAKPPQKGNDFVRKSIQRYHFGNRRHCCDSGGRHQQRTPDF